MLELFAKIRFLPVLIFTATMMLSVKAGDIYRGVDGFLTGGIQLTQVQAQEEAGDKVNDEDAAPDAGLNTEDNIAEPDGFGGEDYEETGPTRERVLADDPTLLTQAEIDLLQQLAERRDALDGRERELDEREGLLAAAEARINTQFREMQMLEATIRKLIQTYDDQQKAKIESLVKLYQNMKPKDAAKIFEDLEMDTLLLVVEGMAERKLAPIMAKMNPERARDLTIELVRLRELPPPGSPPDT